MGALLYLEWFYLEYIDFHFVKGNFINLQNINLVYKLKITVLIHKACHFELFENHFKGIFIGFAILINLILLHGIVILGLIDIYFNEI